MAKKLLKKRTEAQLASDYLLTCQLRQDGKTWREVADIINSQRDYTISHVSLMQHYNRVNYHLIENTREEHIQNQLALLQYAKEELINAWEKSKGKRTKKKVKSKADSQSKNDKPGPAGSKADAPKLIPDYIEVTEEELMGDASFLVSLIKVMEREAKLLGLDAPTKISREDGDGDGTEEQVIYVIEIPNNGRDVRTKAVEAPKKSRPKKK